MVALGSGMRVGITPISPRITPNRIASAKTRTVEVMMATVNKFVEDNDCVRLPIWMLQRLGL